MLGRGLPEPCFFELVAGSGGLGACKVPGGPPVAGDVPLQPVEGVRRSAGGSRPTCSWRRVWEEERGVFLTCGALCPPPQE